MWLCTTVGVDWGMITIADRFLLSITDAFLLRGVVGDCEVDGSARPLVGVGMRLVGVVGPIGRIGKVKGER